MRLVRYRALPVILFGVLGLCGACRTVATAKDPRVAPLERPKSAHGKTSPAARANLNLPIVFEQNQGQFRRDDDFVARGPGYLLSVEKAQTKLTVNAAGRQRSIVMSMANACENARFRGENPYSGVINYLHGNDPARWVTHIRSYRRVRMDSVYPGVDLQFHGADQRLEYDFTVAPGSSPDVIRLDFAGMDDLHVDRDGNLVLGVAGQNFIERKPVAYQKNADGSRSPVGVSFNRIDGKQVGFSVDRYDPSRELVIDPVLVFSTPIGVSDIRRVAIDNNGNIVLAGVVSYGDEFSATPGAVQSIHSDGLAFQAADTFVMKVTPDANDFLFATFLGGTGDDEPIALGVTSGGDPIVAGSTASFDFPFTPGAFMTSPHFSSQQPMPEVFITRLSSDGSSLVYSSHFSSLSFIILRDLAVDSSDRPVLVGYTDFGSSAFPTTVEFPNTGNISVSFVTRLTADGSKLDLSFLFGGRQDNVQASAVALDATNNIYITGETSLGFNGGDLPVVNAAQATCTPDSAGAQFCSDDAFLAKFTPSGQTIFATYWGGSGSESPTDVAVSPDGGATIVGSTSSFDLPLVNPRFPRATSGNGGDGFLAKFSPTGSVVMSTYLDGNNALTAKYNSGGDLFVGGDGLGSFTPSYTTVYSGDLLSTPFEYICDFCQPIDSTVDSAGNFYFIGNNILMPTQPAPLTRLMGANTSEEVAHLSKIDMTASGQSFRSRISFIYPEGAPTTGGTQFSIQGPYLIGGLQATQVLFDGVPATSVGTGSIFGQNGRPNQNYVFGTTPAHGPGTVTVDVVNNGTHDILENGFTFVSPTPSITSITPSSVLFPRQVDVTITGSGFVPGTRVYFVDPNDNSTGAFHPLSAVRVINDSTIIARSTWERPGTYGVRIELPYLTFPDNFVEQDGMFVAQSPAVQTMVPNWGRVSGGVPVEIDGFGFLSGVTVLFDGTPGTVTSTTAGAVKVQPPAHAAGFVDVTVQNPGNPDVVIPKGFRYVEDAPQINSLFPTHGSTNGGTGVTITGLNFHPDDMIQVGGIVVTNKTFSSSSSWFITTPPHRPGAVGVIVVSQQGAGSSNDFGSGAVYTYDGPNISSISPSSGPTAGGQSVTISGSGFVSGATVMFGGASATVVPDCCSLQVTTPAHAAGQVDVQVTNPDGTTGVLTKGYFYKGAAPVVSQVSPNRGSTGGETPVTITGSNFLSGAVVTFGTVTAHNVTYVNDTTLTALTPSEAAGTVDVSVTNIDAQAGTLTGGYTYVVGPSIGTITPAFGPDAGGTSVTINGANLDPAVQVTFGGLAAASVSWQSASKVIATTPAHAAGDVDVVLTNPGTLTATKQNGYRFLPPPPTLTNFNPTTGPPGTSVTITGTNYQFVTDVQFFNNVSATFTVDSTTQITAKVPNAAATGPITVITQSGSVTSSQNFVFQSITPIVTSFTPTGGAAGTVVTVTGSLFTGATSVKFGGVSAASFTVNSDTQITVTAPSGVTGPVCVTTPGPFTGCSSSDFTFPPRITGFTPPQGVPGASITISGANFQGATAVRFNGVAATSFTVNGPASITAVVPSAATTGPVTVTTPAGSGTSITAFGVPPAVSSFTPQRGNSGNTVTISGVRFTGASAVQFNGANATFTVVNDSTITTTVPASVTTGPITVTTPGGTGTSPIAFTVAAVPSITGFTPTKGAVGTSVTITGSNLSTAVAVNFNGASAAFKVNSDTSITATVPSTATNGPISITNDLGTSTTTAIFSLPPVLTTFTPNAGAPGATVVIGGDDFVGATAVTFNGVAAIFTVNAQDRITTTVPASATTGSLTITTGYGSVSSLTAFTVLAPNTPTLTAIATSPSSVQLNWTGSSTATYQVRRIATKADNFAAHVIATVNATSFLDTGLAAGTTYLYEVYNTGSGAISNNDYATTIMFTDDPLTPGTVVKAMHLLEIRRAVNAMRTAAGLAAATWTDSAPAGLPIKPIHITELRNALNDALLQLGRYASFSDPSINSGSTIRLVHIQELRQAVK